MSITTSQYLRDIIAKTNVEIQKLAELIGVNEKTLYDKFYRNSFGDEVLIDIFKVLKLDLEMLKYLDRRKIKRGSENLMDRDPIECWKKFNEPIFNEHILIIGDTVPGKSNLSKKLISNDTVNNIKSLVLVPDKDYELSSQNYDCDFIEFDMQHFTDNTLLFEKTVNILTVDLSSTISKANTSEILKIILNKAFLQGIRRVHLSESFGNIFVNNLDKLKSYMSKLKFVIVTSNIPDNNVNRLRLEENVKIIALCGFASLYNVQKLADALSIPEYIVNLSYQAADTRYVIVNKIDENYIVYTSNSDLTSGGKNNELSF